jgi:hypothetical protein
VATPLCCRRGAGADDQGADIDNPSLKGLIPRIVEQIFASIMSADVSIEYTVKVSYMEIYMEKIKDLLQRELILPHLGVEAHVLQPKTTICRSTRTRRAGCTSRA